ncbi:MAG: hypothetical protein ACREPH_04370 [Rhodanobacteraceae bacterium]
MATLVLLTGCGGSSLASTSDCTASTHCYDAGAFSATVTEVVPHWGQNHKNHFVRLNVRFHNSGVEPLILAFRQSSAATLTDDKGNGYTIDQKYTSNVVGLGWILRTKTNDSFVIAPGSTRDASLIFNSWPGENSLGKKLNANFSVVQLHPAKDGKPVSEAGEYTLSFADLDSGGDTKVSEGI